MLSVYLCPLSDHIKRLLLHLCFQRFSFHFTFVLYCHLFWLKCDYFSISVQTTDLPENVGRKVLLVHHHPEGEGQEGRPGGVRHPHDDQVRKI